MAFVTSIFHVKSTCKIYIASVAFPVQFSFVPSIQLLFLNHDKIPNRKAVYRFGRDMVSTNKFQWHMYLIFNDYREVTWRDM